MKKLTKENSSEFIGKRIKFFSAQYRANYPCEGVATIKSVDFTKNHPFACDIESGDNLNFAFVDRWGEICIGDEDRHILIEVV